MSLLTRVQRYADPYDSAQRDFDTMLGRFFGSRVLDGGEYPAPYGVDVREDGDHIYVEAELPGAVPGLGKVDKAAREREVKQRAHDYDLRW